MIYILAHLIHCIINMAKQNFDNWIWDKTDVKIQLNTEKKLLIYFYWYVGIKKNSKNFFRWRLMSSPNYQHWHKIITNKLKDVEWKYNYFPCEIKIQSIAWNKRKADVDNMAQWIMDTLVELWALPDDNKFIISKLTSECIGYRKNLAITKVDIEPYTPSLEENDVDYKEHSFADYKHLFVN